MLHIVPILKDNNCYVISDKNNCIVIDPGSSEELKIFCKKNNLTIKAILITHYHWDHTDGVAELKNAYKCPVYGPPINTKIEFEVDFVIKKNTKVNNVYKILNNASLDFTTIDLPGHCATQIGYYFYQKNMLFSGDAIFPLSIGRVFDDGSHEQAFNSINKIKKLPSNTLIYGGHEYAEDGIKFAKHIYEDSLNLNGYEQTHQGMSSAYPLILSEEIQLNPFFGSNNNPLIDKLNIAKSSNPIEVFTKLRVYKDNFK